MTSLVSCSRRVRRTAAAALTLLLLAAPAAAENTNAQEFATGAAAILANLFYMPAKFIYAAGGSMVAGAAWAFSGGDAEVAGPILDAAVRGDYVIESGHLRREKEIEFIGRRAEHLRAREPGNVASGGDGWGEPVQEDPRPSQEGF